MRKATDGMAPKPDENERPRESGAITRLILNPWVMLALALPIQFGPGRRFYRLPVTAANLMAALR